MGSAGSADRGLGVRQGWPRRRLLALPGRGAADAVPREAEPQGVRPGRQREPAPLRPRLQVGDVARRRGEPVPHRSRLLAVGRRHRRGHAGLRGAAWHHRARRAAPRRRTPSSSASSARPGHPQYSIGENKYLADHASTLSYDVTITINDDDSWSYDETTMLKMDEFPEPFAHTDRNTLRRVS